MHEMSIALSIIEIIEKEFKKSKANKVTSVELEIGPLAGIEFESIEFAFTALKADSLIKDAEIIITKPDAKAQCLDCNRIFAATQIFDKCPNCFGNTTQIISGKELRVKAITVE